jgi:16S rRNA (guanine(966)-N(2))-methyltransferase RsmD
MPLRVIGGELGGRVLRGPPRTGVRPTSDRVREALFEILGARGTAMRVLDLYSGTGALGIEAMSRGAEYCDFVEADSKACEVIRDNLRRTGLLDRTRLWPMTVARALDRLSEPYDLVVADPPYEYDRAGAELASVVERGLLADGGTVVAEHSQRKQWPGSLAGLSQLTSRRYGDTRITLYARQ